MSMNSYNINFILDCKSKQNTSSMFQIYASCFLDGIYAAFQQGLVLGKIRQHCRLNIWSYVGWIDKYCICQFNQYNYKYWDGSAV